MTENTIEPERITLTGLSKKHAEATLAGLDHMQKVTGIAVRVEKITHVIYKRPANGKVFGDDYELTLSWQPGCEDDRGEDRDIVRGAWRRLVSHGVTGSFQSGARRGSAASAPLECPGAHMETVERSYRAQPHR